MKNVATKIRAALLLLFILVNIPTVAFASNATDVTQTINAGSLTTDIMDASRVTVASPTFAMGAKTFSFNCLSGGSASTGNLGTNAQRLYLNNPDAADNGWTLTIAATGGATSTWNNGGNSAHFDFNDPTGGTAGCSDGADADSYAGQLSIDGSAGTLTTDCVSCGTTGVTKGSNAAFSQGVTDSITILSAAAGSDDIWRGYLTGASMSQVIPAEQAADSYTINFTLTATSL